jgi:hypothetical protein
MILPGVAKEVPRQDVALCAAGNAAPPPRTHIFMKKESKMMLKNAAISICIIALFFALMLFANR